MANKEQVALLRQGAMVWNHWREENPGADIDLNNADLSNADLSRANLAYTIFEKANFERADLRWADLRGVSSYWTDFAEADFGEADLSEAQFLVADFRECNFKGADFQNTKLHNSKLWRINLSRAILKDADLSHSDLTGANLSSADFSNASLSFTNLTGANLSGANLSGVNFDGAQVIAANFTRAILTGACIYEWQIGSSTLLEDIKCDYIFRTCEYGENGFGKIEFLGRLPVDSKNIFAPGEFAQRFQIIASALETIDITFTEGIDWQAFFQSFQDLRDSRPDEDISIQGLERKGEAFVVRLEVEPEADKASIETQVKQLYAHELAALEDRLRLQSEEIAYHRQTQSSLLHIVQTMAEKDSISQTFHGPVGNVAGNNYGTMTATITQNQEAISQLITALRASAQTFPTEQKEEVLMGLDDLEEDLSEPKKQEPKRIGRKLQRLIAAGTAAATIAGGAATFSGDVNEFTQNVLELGEKIGIAREDIQGNQTNP
jgi:uncharacterized protein YjbI with pentapeptide repeats